MLVRTPDLPPIIVTSLDQNAAVKNGSDKNGQWRRDPTRNEILDACHEIQSTWTIAERARRQAKPSGWT